MTIQMEVKKHKLEQLQSGEWKLTLTVHSGDMSMELIQAEMGHPYMAVMEAVDYDNPKHTDNHTADTPIVTQEKTEGEKLRTRAVMLCKNDSFKKYLEGNDPRTFICDYCGIESRSEIATNIDAQRKFNYILQEYGEWLNPIDEQYKDNLDRG